MTQLDLMSYTPVIDRDVKPAARPSIEERFRAFHAANPHVLEELLKLARAHLNAGATYISSKALYEACRVTLRTHHGDDYKLNNDYTLTVERNVCAVLVAWVDGENHSPSNPLRR